MNTKKNASQLREASEEACMYSWSSSCQASRINPLTIWLSVISGLIDLRCLTRIASSCAASGEILMLRGKRPEPLRFPPQFGLGTLVILDDVKQCFSFFDAYDLT